MGLRQLAKMGTHQRTSSDAVRPKCRLNRDW